MLLNEKSGLSPEDVMAKSFILLLHVVEKLLRTISSVALLASEPKKQLIIDELASFFSFPLGFHI